MSRNIIDELRAGEVFNPYGNFPVLRALRAMKNITAGMLRVYEALVSHNAQGRCFPSVTLIARESGTSVRQAQRRLRALEREGLLRCERTFGEHGRQRSNIYRFIVTAELAEAVAGLTSASSTRVPPTSPATASTMSPSGVTSMSPIRNQSKKSSSRDQEGINHPSGKLVVIPKCVVEANDEKSSDDDSDDDDPQTPLGKLSMAISAKGQTLSIHNVRTIKEQLELRNIPLDQFIEFALPHLTRPSTQNPIGLLWSILKRYHSMTQPAIPAPGRADLQPECRCSRSGIVSSDPLVYCECGMGQDLARADKWKAARRERLAKEQGA